MWRKRFLFVRTASRSAIVSHQEWENTELENRQPHPVVCPRRASSWWPGPSSGWLEADTSCERPRVESGNRFTRTASTIHGRIDEEIFNFDTSLQQTWTYHRQHFLPRLLQQNLRQTKHEENTIHPLISAKTRIAKYADVRKLRGRHAKEILTIGRTELRLPQDLVIRKQQTTRFSMKSKNRECITTMQSLCKAWRRNGFKVIHASQNQLRRRREVFEHSYTQKEIRDPFIRIILWNLFF